MTGLALNPYSQFLDDAGVVLSNGTLTFNVNNTTTISTIFTDLTGLVAQSNPYTLDASGRLTGDVYYDGLKRMIVKDSSGATIRTLDDVATLTDEQVGQRTVPTTGTFTALGDTSYSLNSSFIFNITLPLEPDDQTFVRFYTTNPSLVLTLLAQGSDFIQASVGTIASATGTHDGGAFTQLEDSTATFTENRFRGIAITNTTTVDTGIIDENTTTGVTGSPSVLFSAGDAYLIDSSRYKIVTSMNFTLLEIIYENASARWQVSMRAGTDDAVLFNPGSFNSYPFIDGGFNSFTLKDLMAQIDAILDVHLDPDSYTVMGETAVTFNLGTRANNKVTEFTGSTAAVATINTNLGIFWHLFFNNGTVDVTVTTAVDITTLSFLNGARISTSDDIIVPPGGWCFIRTNEDAEARVIASPSVVKDFTGTTQPQAQIATGVLTIPDTVRHVDILFVLSEVLGVPDTITSLVGGHEGQMLVFRTVVDPEFITWTDSGSINLAGNFVTATSRDTLTLVKSSTAWYEVSRSTN